MPFVKNDPRINRNGAGTKQKLVLEYRATHPGATKDIAAKDLNVSMTTIDRWWDSAGNQIPVKYKYPDMEKLKYIEEKGDWIDLRAAETVEMEEGEFRLIDLGVAMKLPKGYEAIFAPRSSTFMRFGIIQANSIGVIDESYCGPDDYWRFPAIALRKTRIEKGDRICQFRILPHQPSIIFALAEDLDGENRGGFGSTGKN